MCTAVPRLVLHAAYTSCWIQLLFSWRNWVHAWAFNSYCVDFMLLEGRKEKKALQYLAFLLKHPSPVRQLKSTNLVLYTACYLTWIWKCSPAVLLQRQWISDWLQQEQHFRNEIPGYQSYLQHILPSTFNISWFAESSHYHSIHFWKLSTKEGGSVVLVSLLLPAMPRSKSNQSRDLLCHWC